MKRTHQLGLHNFFYYLFAATLMLGACKKGDPGPAGDKGDKGDNGANGQAGPAGPAGPAGQKGDPGTANVIYSDWLDVAFTKDPTNNDFFALIDAPKITDELLSTGEIKVYLNTGPSDSKFVRTLPYSYGTAQIMPLFYTSTIYLTASLDVSTKIDNTTGKKLNQYRYILIPGSKAARMTKNINWDNYEEVKAYLGLKD